MFGTAVFILGGLFNLKLPDDATEVDGLDFAPDRVETEGLALSEGRAPDFEGSGNAATLTTRRIGFCGLFEACPIDGDLSGRLLVLNVGEGIVEPESVFRDEDGARSLGRGELPVNIPGASIGASGLRFTLAVGRGGSAVAGGFVVGRDVWSIVGIIFQEIVSSFEMGRLPPAERHRVRGTRRR